MNVTKQDIVEMKPRQFKPFICEDAYKMQSAASIISAVKRLGMPEGVVDYEFQKFFDTNIIMVHAMGENCSRVLNK